jgi:hypothetical protein
MHCAERKVHFHPLDADVFLAKAVDCTNGRPSTVAACEELVVLCALNDGPMTVPDRHALLGAVVEQALHLDRLAILVIDRVARSKLLDRNRTSWSRDKRTLGQTAVPSTGELLGRDALEDILLRGLSPWRHGPEQEQPVVPALGQHGDCRRFCSTQFDHVTFPRSRDANQGG